MRLAPYDTRLPSYERHSSLIVATETRSWLFFNKLVAGGGDFAVAETLPATLDGRLLDNEPVAVPAASARWLVLRRRITGSVDLLDLVAPEH